MRSKKRGSTGSASGWRVSFPSPPSGGPLRLRAGSRQTPRPSPLGWKPCPIQQVESHCSCCARTSGSPASCWPRSTHAPATIPLPARRRRSPVRQSPAAGFLSVHGHSWQSRLSTHVCRFACPTALNPVDDGPSEWPPRRAREGNTTRSWLRSQARRLTRRSRSCP